jgi:hypothetical protein
MTAFVPMTDVDQEVLPQSLPNELRLQVLFALCQIYKTALFCSHERDLTKTCLEIIERLTCSQFGWFGELNRNNRVDMLAISDPGWSNCRIPGSNETKLVDHLEIRGLWSGVFTRGESLIIDDPDGHPDRVGLPDGHPPITSLLCVPLKLVRDTVGIICLANKQGGYLNTDLQLVEAIVTPFYEILLQTRSLLALREKEEQYRKDSDSKYRMIFNNTGANNAVVNVDGTFLLVNEKSTDFSQH